jgi:hypothetical protein
METYVTNKTKEELLKEPHKYAWNIVLRFKQFTQEEILLLRDFLPLVELIRFQDSVTLDFLHAHFQKDIDDSYDVDWNDCINEYNRRNT